jgi:dATP pyrophosphohydrolase
MQFIAGGGENDETPLQAAKREVFEESGIADALFQQLVSICYIPTNIFSNEQRQAWGEDVFVIPEYSFGAETKSDVVRTSDEHVNYKWACYNEALSLLKWDINKTALFELNSRLTMNREVQ